MKRFFNVYTGAMLAVIVIAMLAAVLNPAINWLAVIWMVIAAMWVVYARSNQLTAEDWKDLYDWQSRENTRLLERVDDLRKQNSDYAEKYQTTAQDLDDMAQKVEELTQALEAKKSVRKTSKKAYTEQDQARIREEMKAGGMIKDED